MSNNGHKDPFRLRLILPKGGGGAATRWLGSLLGRRRRSNVYMAPYRRLALQLNHDLKRPDSSRSVLLATPTDSNCSAHGSLALAYSLGSELRRPVLVVDISPTRPEASRVLDCLNQRGCSDLLNHPDLLLEQLVLPTTHENVFFLPAGSAPNSAPPPSSDDLRTLLRSAEEHYEFVVLSGGSVLTDFSALAVAPHVGRALLLVEENKTRVTDLDAAQEALYFCNTGNVGLVHTTSVREVVPADAEFDRRDERAPDA